MSANRLLVLGSLFLVACPDQGLTTHNAEPEVTIAYPSDGEQVEEGVTTTLMGFADDADDSASTLVATWSSGGETLCDAASVESDGETTCQVALSTDHDAITLVVQDPGGATGSDHVTIEVVATGSPLVTLDTPLATGTYYSDRLVEFTGTVGDEEDAPTELTVGIDSSLDGELGVNIDVVSDGSVSAWATLSEGEHALTLWAEDSSGKRGSDNVVIQVGPPNSDPSCAITAPESGATVEEGATLIFEAEVDDADIAENELEVNWSSDQDGELGSSTPSSSGAVAFSWSDLSAATHIVTMEVLDEVGGSCTDFVLVTVGSGPSVSITAPAFGDMGDEGENLVFEATVSDGEDDPEDLDVSWESDVDGVFSTASANSSGEIQFQTDDLTVGDHTVTVTVTDSDGMDATDTVEVSINGAPGAPVVSLTPDPADTEDTLAVSIDTAASDPEGDTISYGYAWYLDGVLSTASTSSTLDASDTTRDDVWTVEVTPNDGRIDGEPAQASLTIGNAAPSVSSVALSPSSAGVGDTISCSWSFSDPDGDTDQSTVAWTVDGAAAGTATTLSSGFAEGETVTCTVTPYDGTDTGGAVSASMTIGNSLPSVSSVTISPSSPSVSDDLSCSYGFSDADGDADVSTLAWTIGGSTVGTSATLVAGTHAAGDTVTCTVTPHDGTDAGTPVAATVVVTNSAPTISAVSITPTSPDTDDTISAAVSASDPDGDSLTASYAWYVDGALVAATGSTLDGTSWFDKGQTVYAIATVNDGSTDSSPVTSNTVTVANTAPDAPVVAISPSSATEGDSIQCTVVSASSDADGDSVTYSMTWTADGAAYGGATTSSWSGDTIPASVTTAGESWVCTATPNDGSDDGMAGTASLTIGAGNAAPSVTSLLLSPTSAYTDDTITATATTYDADGDTVTVSYAWYVDGVATGTTGTTLSGVSWFDKDQTVYVVATPNDGTDDGVATTSSTLTILNAAPTAPGVSITPSGPVAGTDDLACGVHTGSSDDDGDTVTYSMSWTVDGAAYTGTSTSSWSGDTVPASATSASEVWVCTVTPNDGDDDGSTASASVTVVAGNSAPSVTSLTLSPGSVYTDDTITASVSTYDDDGDAVTVSYDWYVDGVSTGETGTTLSGTSWFDKDQDVYVIATPNDGSDDGSSVTSSTLTVLNTPPTTPGISISPSAPVAGTDDLVCSIDSASTDDDGDSLLYTFTWTVDGAAYTGAGTTTWSGDTVSSSATSSGEVWVCTVTPHDGDEAGTAATASVTIDAGNSLPVVTSLSLSPSSVYTDDTITASASTSDADGDTVTVSFDWYVDGVSTGATGSSLSGVSWFDRGQDVYVIATPNDGTDDGSPVSSSTLTVLNSAPDAPVVSIDPSSPVEAVDELVCGVDTAASDDDGDSVSYSMSWTVDGAAYTATSTTSWSGDTVPASATTAGEVWICTVTPNDGTDDGSTATTSVTIQTEGCPLYVDSSVPPGGDGSYADPLPNIAYGLAYAASSGCEEVILKAGTYDENVDFGGQAVTVSSESGPEVTIISPSAGGNVVTFNSGETTDSVLEGVTVTGGTTHGVYISSSSPTIQGCIITGNSASSGGGVYASSFDGVLNGNTIISNTASSGAGLYMHTGSAEISGNWFETNTASSAGGGMWLHATALVTGNVLLENSNQAIYLNASGTSSRDGSNIVNNTIVGTSGYGFYIDYYYTGGSYYYPTSDVINNIVYDSTSWDVYVSGSHSNVFSHVSWQDNNVYGGSGYNYSSRTDSNGNIAQDPGFTDEAAGDFSLAWGSLCIDVGQDPSGYGVDQDYDGEVRTQGPRTDMGAFEYAGPTDDCDGVDDGSQCATACPVYVDPTVMPGGNGDVADPYASILYAQTYRGSCDEIALEPGTYDEQLDFEGEDLYVYSTSGAASTVIDPSVGLNVVTFDSGETTDAILEGVTVTGGTTHGVYIASSSPTIQDCIITGNSASSGGGVYASSFDGVLDGNTIISNSASSGAGLYLHTGSAEITGNWFEANSASSAGGGMWLHATALVTGNVLLENSSNAIYLNASGTSSRDGSNIVNNTIVGTSGYGFYIDYYYTGGSYYYPTSDVINNIVYDSTSWDVYVSGSHSNVFSHVSWQDNNVYGGSGYNYSSRTDSNGNIAQDPGFTDEAADDFSLAWGSLCIDVGQDPSGYGVDQDYDGEVRTQGPRTDMGAFEYAGPTDDCDGVDDGSQCATACPVYVDPTVMPGGNGDVADPYASILYAQTYRGSCDEIALEPGTYDEQLDFEGEDLYVYSTSGAASTVIDPSVGLNVVTFDSGETTDAILEGVTVTGGTTHGVYISSSSPTIQDCIISGNSASSGGGVYASSFDGVLDGNTISSNSASSGAGLYMHTGSAEITGNWFEANSASSAGGGMWLHATALVANNVLLENSSHAIYLNASGTSSRDGSDIVNNTIVRSTGYGFYIDYYYTGGSYYYPTSDVVNNIVYDSTSYDVYVSGTHSNVFSHVYWHDNDVYGGGGYNYSDRTGSNGNVSQDPNFTDETNDDFSLAWPSAYCIDAGQDASGYGVTTDIDGTSRPQGLGYDIGAYESY